ncbi:hypothetical protein IYX23_07665 [Methylocystis sp. L43]|uniref:hypothetical protein n=1 Tax=unclassified Methylocystis TaxID=2625913 RepID=UPI0018C32E58|nr:MULTISPECIES: hypothetical protein [unclassified Methylocystis]MBG0797543.1 hypothetical protein [Methylocystis sp. L43]MBG0805148.1 hypothetical protein [Methylocystis sp. H15]
MAESAHTPSRRAMLAGLAATPVAGLPAIAGGATEADPIFAAIEKYQRAAAAFNQSEEGTDQDAACSVYFDADIDLHSTKPTTPAGAAKFLRFIADFLDEDDIVNDNWIGDMVGDSIRNAVAVLEREALS